MPRMNSNCVCLLLLAVLAIVLPVWGNVVSRRDTEDGDTATPASPTGSDDSDVSVTPPPGDCKEVKYPCTRVYSVQKPVKQCISYLCVTSVRRVYMVNKEICKRIMCKEHEVMEDEKCRQLAGLPPRPLPALEEGATDGNESN